LNRQLDMTTLKRICIPRGKMIASLAIIAGMLTACGSGSNRNTFSTRSPMGAGGFSSFSGQPGAFTPTQFGGLSQSLPQNTLNTGNSQNSSNSTPTNASSLTGSTPWGSGMSGQLTVSAAQDFGHLSSCYQQVLNQGRGFFRQGYTNDAIFSGAGQEIVSCYRAVIQQRTQQFQVQQWYQQQLYHQQYQQRMLQLYQYFSSLNGNQIFEPVRPPGLR